MERRNPLSSDDGVGLSFTCPRHGGRLFTVWLNLRTDEVEVDTERSHIGGGWDLDPQGRGSFTISCVKAGCRQQQQVTQQWLDRRLRQVAAAFAAGVGPRIVPFPLSEVGTRRGAEEVQR
jgi:hypothetical protein